jgi:hypothetical protein
MEYPNDPDFRLTVKGDASPLKYPSDSAASKALEKRSIASRSAPSKVPLNLRSSGVNGIITINIPRRVARTL